MKIEFFKHNIDEKDILKITEVLNSIFLTTGNVVKDFETAQASYLSCSQVIGVTSCTAALHLCLLAWNIGEGDEVITTPMSFCATSNSIIHAGARPVFVDVEADTGNIDADLIEEKITSKTKAIIPVHLYGQMCDMKKLRQIADKHGLIIIEDAAHCIEGVRDGIRVGQLGDAACFSFYATKNITSGEGGAIATNNEDKADVLRMLRLHGIDKGAADRYTTKYQHWDMPILGWKYNMDNLQASLLLGQIARIEELWLKREAIASKYEEAFAGKRNLGLLKPLPGVKHARHLFTIQTPEGMRDTMLFALQEKGIGVAVNYRAIHLLNYYRKTFGFKEGAFPVAEDIGNRTISIPLYPKLTGAESDYIINAVKEELHER